MRTLAVCALLAGLVGCGSSEPPPPAPPQKTVFDPMLEQRDKAQAIADRLPVERKENLDKAIDAN